MRIRKFELLYLRIRQIFSRLLKHLRYRQILSGVITGFGLVYLLLVLVGYIEKDRLGQTEVAIFITIILLNSEMIERLSKFTLGKDGMSVELEEKVGIVEERQEEISGIQKEQQEEIEHIAGFLLSSSLLTRHQRGLLNAIASDRPFKYVDKTAFEKDLIKLREYGLLRNIAGGPLNIREIPAVADDLRRFVGVSDRGRVCLRLMKKSRPSGQ
jgi:hypothetical protein